MPLPNGLIRCDSPNASVFAKEVVVDEPIVQILLHLPGVLIDVPFGGALFDEAISSFDHSIGFGCVRPCLTMLDLVVPTELGKRMDAFGFGAPAIPETRQSELAPVVGENLLDPERVKSQAALQKVLCRLLVSVFVNPQQHQAGGSINGHETVSLLTLELGQIKAVDVQVAWAVFFEGARLSGRLLLFLQAAAAAVPNQKAMQAGTTQVGQNRLGGFEKIVQRQLPALPHPQHHLLFLAVQRTMRGVRTARAVGLVLAAFPGVNGGRRNAKLKGQNTAALRTVLNQAALSVIGGRIRVKGHSVGSLV